MLHTLTSHIILQVQKWQYCIAFWSSMYHFWYWIRWYFHSVELNSHWNNYWKRKSVNVTSEFTKSNMSCHRHWSRVLITAKCTAYLFFNSYPWYVSVRHTFRWSHYYTRIFTVNYIRNNYNKVNTLPVNEEYIMEMISEGKFERN